VTWGHQRFGVDSSSVSAKLVGVDKIYSNYDNFIAVLQDRTVVSWP